MIRGYALPQLVLAALTVAVALTLFTVGATSTATLGVYNAQWDGTSEVRTAASESGIPTTLVENTSTYGRTPANDSLAVVLSPTDPYGSEAQRIRSFVRSGGTLLVAEDYGPGGNELLTAVGADARIDGTPLRDEQRAGPSPAFPLASPTTNSSYTRGVDTVMLNHGTVVNPGNATTVMASSEFSYLDRNRNEELDERELLASRPVVTVESVGSGTVVTVSDPSVFINSMLERRDNAAFLDALVGDHDRILLDVSHTSALPPLVALQLALQESTGGMFVLATLSILAVIVFADPPRYLSERFGRGDTTNQTPSPSREALASAVRDRHPEWDDERIDRVTDSLMERRQKPETDD